MPSTVYLDESGDLGWSFLRPYRAGGSSRFLTIAFIICPNDKKHLLTRIVKDTYQNLGKQFSEEIKGSHLTIEQKSRIADRLTKLLAANPDITIGYITVRKDRVGAHIQADANKLYNYMIRLSLIELIENIDIVTLLRDNRSVKVKSGNSLIDYLQTTLWFDRQSKTTINDLPCESHKVRNLILTDWVNNIIWGHYEDNNSAPYNIIANRVNGKRLFF